MKTFDSRKNLSDTLARLLLLKQNKIQQLTEGNLFDTRSQQIHVSMLAQFANVQEQFIPKNLKNKKQNIINTFLQILKIVSGKFCLFKN